MSRRKNFNLTLPIGIGIIAVAAVMIGLLVIGSQPDKRIFVVPAADIPAYREISPEQLTEVRVNADEALDIFLTAEEVNELTKDGGRLYSLASLPAGTLIGDANIGNDATRSLQVVSRDEVLVGVTTNLPGALIGVVQPGRVVDIHPEDSNATTVAFGKVIAIGDKTAAEGLAGVQGVPKSEGEADGQGFIVVVAVPQAEAKAIAGKQVFLSLHPFCQTTQEGLITATSEDKADACAVPSGRVAAGGDGTPSANPLNPVVE